MRFARIIIQLLNNNIQLLSNSLDIGYFEYCRNNKQFRPVYHFEILASDLKVSKAMHRLEKVCRSVLLYCYMN